MRQDVTSAVAARFSAAAQTYHELAAVQVHAAKRLMELIGNCQSPARILEIGSGTGILTARLARNFPSAQIIDAVDISPAMTAEARKKLASHNKINWIVADAGNLSLSTRYALIASSCALHWIKPLKPVLKKLSAMLMPGGQLAIALMTHDTFAELQACRERIAPHKPPRVTLPVETDVRNAVAESGLRIIAEKSETIRRNYSSAREMIRQLHAQGLTGGNDPASSHLLTRSELFHLVEDYDSRYKCHDGVFASYCLYCCVTEKK